ncbi:uncharacterized protein LOC123986147 [Micropterus dolomieu]|uniref:uncharacterized protein LOC123986147 n=1 Tax=Micropterus dolomieu TaxID=147949 RepID=UPI001E8D6A93|nr:uncharacterized protein LOC123986147 [Micropterus dolomieu]
MDLTPVNVEKIIFGASLTADSKLQQPGFTGCLQYFNVTGYTLPVSGHSVMVDVWPSLTLVQSSCSSPGVCFSSPCSEEDTARRGCQSAHCQNQWRCGPAVQNRSCICLYNVSGHTCDTCISTTESHDRCSEAQGSVPMWLIAVILPLISILVIIGMFVALYKVRRSKCQSDSSPQETEQGTDNLTFRFDDNRMLTDTASAGKEKQHDSMSADQQRLSVEFYCDTSLCQPVPNSELEYYEIGSISSAFHSDTASLKLSWHKHSYSTKCVKSDPKQWGDLRVLLAGFKKERTCEEREKSPTKPQNVALKKQLLNKSDAKQSQSCYKKRFPQPEFMEPVQCLTFEEICKLNTPLEQKMSQQASLSRPSKSTTMIDVSSDSETDSTFIGSQSECGQFSIISTRNCIHDQSSPSVYSFRQQDILPVCSFLKHTCHCAAGQHEAESAPISMFEQWENILNMHIPFSSYASVYEDIACLPTESSHSYDMQSDIEETI